MTIFLRKNKHENVSIHCDDKRENVSVVTVCNLELWTEYCSGNHVHLLFEETYPYAVKLSLQRPWISMVFSNHGKEFLLFSVLWLHLLTLLNLTYSILSRMTFELGVLPWVRDRTTDYYSLLQREQNTSSSLCVIAWWGKSLEFLVW